MRYLTLAADYSVLSIRDEQSGPLRVADLDVPQALIDDLIAWNGRYQAVVPMSVEERRSDPAATLIRDLDREGLQLAERLAAAIPDDVKVRYYSEGQLRHLP